jgi:hypothetical protein
LEEKVLSHLVPCTYLNWYCTHGIAVNFRGLQGAWRKYILFELYCLANCFHQYQLLSVMNPHAILFNLKDGTYRFPEHKCVRVWFRVLFRDGIIPVEWKVFNGDFKSIYWCMWQGEEAHEEQRRIVGPNDHAISVVILPSVRLREVAPV